jgi:hypothetical protein
MHRGMHNWYPLWLPPSVHHYITQLNINKGAVGNPVELFLIGLGVGGFFDFLPRAFLFFLSRRTIIQRLLDEGTKLRVQAF